MKANVLSYEDANRLLTGKSLLLSRSGGTEVISVEEILPPCHRDMAFRIQHSNGHPNTIAVWRESDTSFEVLE